MQLLRGRIAKPFAFHRWGPEFLSRSLHVESMVEESEYTPALNCFLHYHLIRFHSLSALFWCVRAGKPECLSNHRP